MWKWFRKKGENSKRVSSLRVCEEEGVFVNVAFPVPGLGLGDLMLICGFENPSFPPEGEYAFHEQTHLGLAQVDDIFGIPSNSDEGDDVIVWLYPVVDGRCVFHHPGPFDAIQLQYNVLKNGRATVSRFLKCVEALASLTPEPTPGTEEVQAAVETVTAHWRSRGVEPGSD